MPDETAAAAPARVWSSLRRVEAITAWREFLALRPAWDKLAATDPDGLLLSHDWIAQAWKCGNEIRRGEKPLIVGVRDRDADWEVLLALRHNLKTRRLCFLEERRCQRLDLLSTHADAWGRLAKYFRGRRDWDRLDLQYLRAPSAAQIHATWPRLGFAIRDRGRIFQRRIRLDRPWEEVEAGFSPYLRANFQRRLRRLQRRGNLEVEVHQSPEGLRRQLQDCFELERSGWKGAHGTAILDDPTLARFYRQLAFRLAATGKLRLFTLRVGGRLVAFEFCVADRHSGRLSALKIAYEEEWKSASPGIVLRWLLLQEVRRDMAVYEFLGEDAPWKAEWGPEVYELRHLRIFNRTLRGQGWLWRGRAAAVWSSIRRS